jgi:NAD(P)-dependent dehydrogenase (short-subunit alcohol dehydrogenase family)
MESAASILDDMRAAVPQGRQRLDDGERSVLERLTSRLVAARPDALEEYQRYQAVRERRIDLSHEVVARHLAGRTVLVTGGTGCIGSMLMEQLSALGPARLVSVSRGATAPWRSLPAAEYLQGDVCDRPRLHEIFARIRPEIVFHLAAQREPARAEVEVHRTITTNVFGTRNLLEAAVEHGVRDVVCASTGKALRPYSPDVYAASKRAAEWLMSRTAARTGQRISAARFTHVVDNSIIADRLRRWCKSGVIRLHSAEIDFYVQSALESAQLLLDAGVGIRPGRVRMHALRNLDWPVNLLDLAVGMIMETRSSSPIYIAGYEGGYESEAFAGLYDPRTAGGISPLINAFEAAAAVPAECAEVDTFDLRPPVGDGEAATALAAVERACAAGSDSAMLRASFDILSRALLELTVRDLSRSAVTRAIDLATARTPVPNAAHDVILDALRRRAAA